MKWAKIRELYVSAAGNSPVAVNEAFIHISEGARFVYAKLAVQELEETDREVTTVPSQDYVGMPSDLEHLITLVNIETGEKLYGEPNGLRGRSFYFEPETGKPAEGPPQWWVVANGRVYLRPTPDQIYTLKAYGKSKAVEITREMLEESPVIPDEYHMAIVYASTASCLRLHPDLSAQLGEGQVLASMENQAEVALVNKPLPKEEENLDRRAPFGLRFPFRSGTRW